MKDLLIGMLRHSSDSLAKAATDLGDKATWSPLDKGRTAIDQVAECALISQWIAGVLTAQAMPAPDWDAFGVAKAALDTTEKALESLTAGTDALAAAITALPDSAAGIDVTLPWGATMTLGQLPTIVVWNNSYHDGQINYISTLL